MWSFPARFLVEFFAQPRDARLPRPAAVAHGRAAGRTATSRRSSRRGATACASSTPIEADRPPRRPRRGHPARRRGRALRRGRPRHPLRPGARAARRRRRSASTSCSARSPTSPTRRCCTPTRACCRGAAARGRAGTTTCSTSPTGKPTVTYHMNRLQSLHADREFCVTLNHTDAIDPDKIIRTIPYAHPVFTADGPGRAGAPRRDQRPEPHALLRRLLGLGLPRGRRRQRRARGRAARGRAAVSTARSTRARSATAASRSARTSSATGSRWPTSTSTSCPRCSTAASCARGPGLVRFRRSDYLGDPATPLDDGRPRARRGAPRQRARRPDPAAHPPAHLRPLLQPGELLLLLRARRRARSRRSSPR